MLLAAACMAAAIYIVLAAGLPNRLYINAPVSIAHTPIAPEVGALAPPIETTALDGKHFSLETLRGRPVIVNFWATWCGPCVAEMPMIQAAYETHRTEGLHVVGVDSGEAPADVLAWKSRFRITFDLIIDRDGWLSRDYRVRGLPSTYFIDRAGIIRHIVYGPLSAAGLDAALSDLLR